MPAIDVFLSHPPEEEAAVARLRAELMKANISIAPRRHELPPGVRWKPALKKALAGSARFLLCFSAPEGSVASFVADEVELALEHARTLPPEVPWLVPVKFTRCQIPAKLLENGSVLAEIDPVDLSIDWADGLARILAGLAPATAAPVAFEMTNKIDEIIHQGDQSIVGVSVSGGAPLDAPSGTFRSTNTIGRVVGDKGFSLIGFERKP